MAEAMLREDHDFVTMATYRADMDELGARGVSIIQQQQREIEDLKRTIWLLVESAGGQIDIPNHRICSFDMKRVRWETGDMPSINAKRFRILPT